MKGKKKEKKGEIRRNYEELGKEQGKGGQTDKNKQTDRQKPTKDRQTPRNRQTGVNQSLVNVALKKFLVLNVITMWVCIDQSQDRNLKNIPQLSYH